MENHNEEKFYKNHFACGICRQKGNVDLSPHFLYASTNSGIMEIAEKLDTIRWDLGDSPEAQHIYYFVPA